jgi:hypothetical protein
MNSTDLWPILKYVGAVIAAVYGVCATVGDFHVERNGRRILSRWAYFGIAFLVLASSLTLLSDIKKDQNERREKKESTEAQERTANDQRQLVEGLTTQTQLVKKTADTLDGVVSTVVQTSNDTKNVSNELGDELDISKKMSGTLGTAVDKVNATSQTARTILLEDAQKVGYAALKLNLLLDPIKANEAAANRILEPFLSDAWREGGGDELELRRGLVDRHADARAMTIAIRLSGHSTEVRAAVAPLISVEFEIAGKNHKRLYGFSYQGDEGISNFVIDNQPVFTEWNGRRRLAVTCHVTYVIPPNEMAGIRLSDLNLGSWFFSSEVAYILTVDSVELSLRSAGMTAVGPLQLLRPKGQDMLSPTDRMRYDGQVQIPSDYFTLSPLLQKVSGAGNHGTN